MPFTASESVQAALLALHVEVHSPLSPPTALASERRLLAVQTFAALLRALAAEDAGLEDVQVGHGLSLLLKAADQGAELAVGGEKELCVTALQTLQLLIQGSSSTDALGFFLPGMSIGLCRHALRASARSSTATAVAALDALIDLLRATVGDDTCASSRTASAEVSLASLATCSPEIVPSLMHKATTPPAQELRVDRSAAWLESTASKLALLVHRLCDALEGNSKSSIRAALARLTACIALSCSSSLPACAERSLRCLLFLANDTWPQVSAVATLSLASIASKSAGHVPAASPSLRMVEAVLVQQLGAFSEACARHEQEVVAVARLLVRAIELAGPSGFNSAVLAVPPRRAMLCSCLLRAFAVAPTKRLPVAFLSPIPFQQDAADGQPLTVDLPRRCQRLSLLSTDEVRGVTLCAPRVFLTL